MRLKTFTTEYVVSFSWASYNWGGPGGLCPESRIRRGAARRGGDGRLTVVGSPVRGGKWNRQTGLSGR